MAYKGLGLGLRTDGSTVRLLIEYEDDNGEVDDIIVEYDRNVVLENLVNRVTV